MSATLKQPMTVEAFLAWEQRQDARFEFDGFQPVAMTGGSSEHSAIKVNLTAAIRPRLRGGPCRIFDSDLKVAVAGSIRYPDAFIVCTQVPRGTTIVTDPVVVFEVLSPSTSYIDRIQKNREYRSTPSIQRYVLLEQTSRAVTVYSRQGESWTVDVLVDDAVLELPEVGVSVPLAELFEGIEFPEDDADRASG